MGSDELKERIKRRVYLPDDEDEYDTISKPLTDIILDDASTLSGAGNDLKGGFISDVTTDASLSPCAVMLGLLYMHRLVHKNPNYLVTTCSRDLFLASMMIASKYLNDEGEAESVLNSEWAKIGKKSKHDIDHLEVDFLMALDWELYAPLEEYLSFVSGIEGRIAVGQMQWRGWSTYSDIVAIWSWLDTEQSMINFTTEIVKVILQSAVVYMMCFTTLFALSTAAIHCLEQSHVPATPFPEAVTSDFSPADYLIYNGNSLKSSALLINTPSQLGLNEKFLPSGFYQRHLPASHNSHGIKNHFTKPTSNNISSTIDMWSWGVARYVWTSISDFCSNGLGLDLKYSVSIVREYLREATKLEHNEMLMYNSPSTMAVG